MATNDTICAVSTAPGVGGIAVVRISGPEALAVASKIWRGKKLEACPSHTAHLGEIIDPASGEVIDQAVATVFRSPRSFTSEDVVELSIHGSTWLQQEVVRLLIDSGARMAEAGEFTRRAFAAGHLDLAQAEAVADVIASRSRASHRLAMSQMRGLFSLRLSALRDQLLELATLLELELDFSEEDVEFASRQRLIELSAELHSVVVDLASSFATGRAIKEGLPVAIVGATNVGKSTLLNRLLEDEKAIVSPIHGTTRDVIEDTISLQGTLLRFIDTAGLRSTTDPIEAIGIERALKRVEQAQIVLWVTSPEESPEAITEAEKQLHHHLHPDSRLIHVVNKADTVAAESQENTEGQLWISAREGQGIDQLRAAIIEAASFLLHEQGDIVVTNLRHYEALSHAAESLQRVIEGLSSGISGDFVAQDLREALLHLGEITGTITTPDILASIFSRFCIGK
ncbi:MAG: tRNA uridine-5-carboxymethylaminomethyl(34) synthesis GTPase MnmE [Bacteroidales bacterium]|nr:tRNA uridine-5-carboxymethylaminomethyl(34) synthesis GTPase MnmE [Bacteroidales bacterium]